MENKGCFQALLPDAYFISEVGYSIVPFSGSVKAEVLLSRPGSNHIPHDWDFAGSFVLGHQRDTGICPVAYPFDRLAVLYNRLMRLLIFTGVPQNECRFSDRSRLYLQDVTENYFIGGTLTEN